MHEKVLKCCDRKKIINKLKKGEWVVKKSISEVGGTSRWERPSRWLCVKEECVCKHETEVRDRWEWLTNMLKWNNEYVRPMAKLLNYKSHLFIQSYCLPQTVMGYETVFYVSNNVKFIVTVGIWAHFNGQSFSLLLSPFLYHGQWLSLHLQEARLLMLIINLVNILVLNGLYR